MPSTPCFLVCVDIFRPFADRPPCFIVLENRVSSDASLDLSMVQHSFASYRWKEVVRILRIVLFIWS